MMPFLMDSLPEKQVFHSRVLRFYGIGESALEERLLDLIQGQSNPTIAPYAKEFEVTLRITASAPTVEQAERLIIPAEQQIRERVGQYVYATGETSLHEVVVRELTERQETIACAESYTGGAISSLLTSVPGSSALFFGSIVCYTNEVKQRLLEVPEKLLATDGAISEAAAKLMAEKVREKMRTTHGVSITGVAGPTSSEGKPVGLAYIGIASEGKQTIVQELRLAGRRQAIIGRGAKFALFYALQRIRER